jgi:hypothetical protein
LIPVKTSFAQTLAQYLKAVLHAFVESQNEDTFRKMQNWGGLNSDISLTN